MLDRELNSKPMRLPFLRRPHAEPAAVRRYQVRALQRLARHAATRVPYYRELFRQARLRPEDIQSPEDLRHLPITTKAELQSRPLSEFLTEGAHPARHLRFTTSGSTGRPTVVYRTRREQYLLQAYRLRSQILCGVRATDLRATLHSRWRGLYPWNRFTPYRLAMIHDREPAAILRRLRRLRPAVLMARPSILDMAALQAARDTAPNPAIRLLFSGAELLSPTTRQRFEDTWQCRVTDEYGTNECVLVASECPACGHSHTCDDAVFVEIERETRAAEPGESGRVIATTLHSYLMPFLRFDLEDVARRPKTPPACSYAFGTLDVIEGRQMDFLSLPDGTSLSPYVVQRTLQGIPGIRRFQVHQDSLEALTLRLEQGAGTSPVAATQALRKIVPASVAVHVETAECLPTPEGGKFHYIRGLTAPS